MSMEDRLIMSKKELERKTLLDGFRCGKLTLIDISKRLDISYRQIKRIWAKYQKEGDIGLCHRSRGKSSLRAYSLSFKGKILTLYQEKYLGFGPTFAAEKLLEDDGLKINAETLRLWLKANGLWSKKRKREVYRERRMRRPCFGDLLQIDGSIHQWFVNDDNYYCLLNMVDDATGLTLALLDKGETTQILLTVFKKWVEKYGIPKAVYVDLKSVYVGLKKLRLNFDEEALFHDGFSVFEQVCRKLGVEIIRAYSAQAKGRVERKHAVFQDRLVKDLKLYGIRTLENANKYLEDKFLNNINTKFFKSPENSQDSHRDPKSYGDLDQIFCWVYKRQLRNDWCVQLQKIYYQIEKIECGLKPNDFINIKKYLDGTMRFWYGESEVKYHKLDRKLQPPFVEKIRKAPSYDPILKSKLSKKNKHKSSWSKLPLILKKVS
jgi:transposase